MYPSPSSDVPQRVAVLYSQATRDALAAQARERGQIYTFVDAYDRPKTWLKGEYAYLAPNGASTFLLRCNIKHDWVEERELTEQRITDYQAILVPNADYLRDETIDRVTRWIRRDGKRLVVTGRTNLPNSLLGLASKSNFLATGYTAWHWLSGSPFAERTLWDEFYVTAYKGYTVYQAEASPGARVLADLIEFEGDLANVETASKKLLGAAIVTTDRTVYISNQVFEFLGGVLQAHLNVEEIRHWPNPIFWGDAIAFFLRRILLDAGWDSLWETRLRSFGSYEGVLSLRHDIHGMPDPSKMDFSMLDYEIQNLIPASQQIEAPSASPLMTAEQAQEWVERSSRNNFIEPSVHNASDTPKVQGRGLYEHLQQGSTELGITGCTAGRHGGGHLHPETLDAMDYVYARDERFLGLCTFSWYNLVEYGVRNPDVVGSQGEAVTYKTDLMLTMSTSGFWFPFHPVITAETDWRVMRGWDRTHEADCSYEFIDTLLSGHISRLPQSNEYLENPVYALQYHPEYATDPGRIDGRGTFGPLRYAINLAERRGFWLANERQLYQRLTDYQDVVFRFQDDGTVLLCNPTSRRIEGMVVEQWRPFHSVWDGVDELIHIVRGRFVTVPPLPPGARRTLRFEPHATNSLRILQPTRKGLEILDARYQPGNGKVMLLVRVCRKQSLCLENVMPGARYRVQIDSDPAVIATSQVQHHIRRAFGAWRKDYVYDLELDFPPDFNSRVYVRLDIVGDPDTFVERTISIQPA